MLFVWKYNELGNNVEFNKLRFSIMTTTAIFGHNHTYELLFVTNPKMDYESRYFSLWRPKNFIFNVTDYDVNPTQYCEEQNKHVDCIFMGNDVIFVTKPEFAIPICESDSTGVLFSYRTNKSSPPLYSMRCNDTYNQFFRSSNSRFFV